MQQEQRTDTSQEVLDAMIEEAGVQDLIELYERVEEVYVAAHGAMSPVPQAITTNGTNISSGIL